MKRDLGDLLDRWSIAKLKSERIGTEENKREYDAFNKELDLAKKDYPQYDIMQWAKLLLAINDNIWQLEAGLKSGKEELVNPHYVLDHRNTYALTNIGVTTLLIRNHNSERVQFKNIVNKIVGEGFQDTKSNHLSGS